MLTHGIPPDIRGGVHLVVLPPYAFGSVPSLFTQLRTDGVHCRESAGAGLEVLKVVLVTDAAFAGHHGAINMRLSFPTPTIGTYG